MRTSPSSLNFCLCTEPCLQDSFVLVPFKVFHLYPACSGHQSVLQVSPRRDQPHTHPAARAITGAVCRAPPSDSWVWVNLPHPSPDRTLTLGCLSLPGSKCGRNQLARGLSEPLAASPHSTLTRSPLPVRPNISTVGDRVFWFALHFVALGLSMVLSPGKSGCSPCLLELEATFSLAGARYASF